MSLHNFYPWGSPKGSSHHKRMPPECCDLIENWIISELLTRKHTCSHVCRHTHKLSAPASWTWSFLHILLISCLWSRDLPCSLPIFPLSPPQADSHKFFLEMAKVRYHLYEAGMIWKSGPFWVVSPLLIMTYKDVCHHCIRALGRVLDVRAYSALVC